MGRAKRLALVLLFCFGVVCWAASACEAAAASREPSVLSSPFVIAGSPEEGEQVQAERGAALADPSAVAEREGSRTRYAGLHREEAVAIAKQTFGIEAPSWMAPGSNGEGPLTQYFGEHSAVEIAPSGKHLVITSTVPLRSAVGSGQLAPTSLTLSEREGAYVPANPLVPVSISKSAGGGVSLPWGISFAPVQAAEPEASVTVGEQVFYPGTATDTSFMVSPVPGGVETSWLLLSQASSQENALRFNLPAGVTLQMSETDPGGAELVREGEALAVIPPAHATEADGSELPVSYSVSGDRLATHVDLEGSVALPVMVDPIVDGNYGSDASSDAWNHWETYTNCSCFGFFQEANRLVTSANPGSPTGAYAEWYIYAPGIAGDPGRAGLARINLSGLGHYTGTNESTLEAFLTNSNGPHPGWTYNPNVGIEGEGPLITKEGFGGRLAVLCADGAGGHEGSNPPLCNENYTAEAASLLDEIGPEAQAYYSNVEITGASIAYLDNTPPNQVVLVEPYGQGGYAPITQHWVKYGSSAARVDAQDEGVGVEAVTVEIPPGYKNSKGEPFFAEETCSSTIKFGFCSTAITSGNVNLSGLETGVHELGVYAYDAAGNVREEEVGPKGEEQHGSHVYPKLYVDHTPPVIPAFGGSLGEASGGGIGSGSYALTFSAEDGSSSAPQSGAHLLTVSVDGSKVDEVVSSCPEPAGVPSAGCFALNGSWTMEGAKYGAGPHTITVTAKDWAGNESSRSIAVTVNEAPSEAIGPGSVNLKTGALRLESTDASVAAAGGELTVGRVYDSRALSQGAGGPLGPQWSLSLPDSPAGGVWQSLKAMPNGSVQALTTGGTTVTFSSNGSGGFVSPAGYQTLALSETSKSPLEYEMTNAGGDGTIFKRASSGEEEALLLVPSTVVQATGAGGLNKMTYVFTKTAEGITEPKEVIAPYPSSINCLAELVQGCRALEFVYYESTTAEGENQKEWKGYKGRLAEVLLVAWSTTEKKMTKTPVADYQWDTLGRLRSEWNPQLNLKTTYGYAGSEALVTAVSPPGQQPWLLHYGTTASDLSSGRLLSVSRFKAEAKLWDGKALKNTKAPQLSTTSPVEGTAVSATKDNWNENPEIDSYQWERCNSSGGECAAIGGAVNETYTPIQSDSGHELRAKVTADTAWGSLMVSTETSKAVTGSGGPTEEPIQPAPNPGATSVSTVEYGVALSGTGVPSMTKAEVAKWGEKEEPLAATAVFPPDEPQSWPAGNYKRATIYYLDSSEHAINLSTPAGGISTAEYDVHGDTTRTLSADNRAAALAQGSKSAEAAAPLYNENKYNTEGTELSQTIGPEHKVKLPSGSEAEARKIVKDSYSEEGAPAGGPYRLVTQTTEAALTTGKEEDLRTVTNSYEGQSKLGWKLHEPTTTTVAPTSVDLTHNAVYSTTTGAEVETSMPGSNVQGTGYSDFRQFGATGSESEKLSDPSSDALDASGDVWVTDAAGGRVEEFSSTGGFLKDFGSSGTGSDDFKEPRGIAINATTKNIYIADAANNRIDELNEKGAFVRAFGYGVSNGEAKLETCTSTCEAGLAGAAAGQFHEPRGIAIDSSGHLWITDYANDRVDEFGEAGEFIAAFGFGVSNGEAKLQSCTSSCKAGIAGSGNGQFKGPAYVALAGGDLFVTDAGNNRVEVFNTNKEYLFMFGGTRSGEPEFKDPAGITASAAGELFIDDLGNNRVVEVLVSGENGAEAGVFGGTGRFSAPEGIAISAAGDVYVVDSGDNRVAEWVPSLQGNTGAYTSQTIYYTPKTEASVAVCQNHPEWANLPCQTQPAHQPEVAGMPALPVTIYKYNIWFEPIEIKSTSGEGSEPPTRTETDGYDPAGRLTSKEIFSTTGTTLPKVSYSYNTETGLPATLSTGSGSSEQKITEEHNALGQLISYTDAAGKATAYEYEKEKDDRLLKISTEKGSQTFGYNETTGTISTLKDSAAGTFSAGYDIEENLVSETMPNGLIATITRNPVGEAVGLEYCKETHCSESGRWYYDNVVPSIHGQWVTQTSSLGTDNYSFNEAGWLTRTQETPTGKGCATRLYAYNADEDRTSLTRRPPGAGGACAAEGGEVEEHVYDTADRLLDAGTAYNPFGDITALPAADAGGTELKSGYYTDGQLASQEQEVTEHAKKFIQSIGYELDPARRTNETITTGNTSSDMTDQYEGPASTPGWLSYTTGEWTRNIFGISGSLAATQTDTETPILQIANLHGDIIGTVPDSETATKLSSATETTEYGVPTVPEPAKYSWLGASALPTELPSGILDMGARSYVPQLGRFLQPDPQAGGSANAYAYTHGNPLNETDPSGQWTLNETSGGDSAIGEGEGTHLENGVGIAAGAIIPLPTDAQAEAAFWADPPWDQVTAGSEEYEEEWEEYEEEDGYGYEYASNHQGSESDEPEAHVEAAILIQPLQAEAGEADGGDGGVGGVEGFRIPIAGGCPSTKDPCYKHHGHGGKANEGANGCSHQGGKGCHRGGGGINITCGDVGAAVGGAAGAVVGGAFGESAGAYGGGAAGGYAGSRAGEAVCN